MIARIERPANMATFAFRVSGFDAGDLEVTGFEGTEGMSQLYDFRVRLCSERGDIDPDLLLGRPAALELEGEYGTRYVHGIVSRFEVVEDGPGITYYQACVVPPHWLLTRRKHSRIFQKPRCADTTIPGVISQVFRDAGLPNDSLIYALSHDYQDREFVVQYRESDWDFVSRLMEEVGIYYYFEHNEKGVSVVVADYKDIHMPYATTDDPNAKVPYRDPNGMVAERDFVYRVRLAGEMQIAEVALDAFDYFRPDRELRVSANGGRFDGLLETDNPGNFTKQKDGQFLAGRRLEGHQVSARAAEMRTTVREFLPGTTFELTDHPTCSGQYLILAVSHKAVQTQSTEGHSRGGVGCSYDAVIRVIPADVQYRPPRVTPPACIHGSQTAIVVGPPGEEIHTDELGRVRVRFHWDQEANHDENASCWIRVSQGMAGGQYGMMFLPRVGQEVIVDFLDGDPDRPIITGRVFNKDHMPPYKLPKEKSISTIRTCSTPGASGGNEIRFDDAKGKEELFFHAQKKMHLRSRGSRYEAIGGNHHVRVGCNSYELVKENRHSKVTLDSIEEVDGTKHFRVAKDVKQFIEGKQYTFIGKKFDLLNSEGIWMGSDTSITLWCKGNFIKLDESGVTIVGKTVKINSGGSAGIPLPDGPDIGEKPGYAAKTDFGHNVRYDVKPESPDKLELFENEPAVNDLTPKDEEDKGSWIEIELVDDLGQPKPGETYEVTPPDGEPITGTLDDQGRARVHVPDPGTCQVSFPNLDQHKWQRD